MKIQKGFTLTELIYVVAMLAILFGIVIAAINPRQRLGENRNLQRRNDIEQFDSFVRQYGLENRGRYPEEIRTIPLGTAREFCRKSVPQETCEAQNLIYLGDYLGNLLRSIPEDPQISDESRGTGYFIYWNTPSEFGFFADKSELDTIQTIGQVPDTILAFVGVELQGDTTEIVDIGGDLYVLHYYTTTGAQTFNNPSGVNEVDYLIVAGGGGGGARHGGGGGAGGFREGTYTIQNSQYSVLVGTGGDPGIEPWNDSPVTIGGVGGDSSVFGVVSSGGGGGGGGWGNGASFGGSLSGGSGGGSGGGSDTGADGNVPETSPSQGNSGGNGGNVGGGFYGGGGGGASDPGGDFDGNAGDGGAGRETLITGESRALAGGGGAGGLSGLPGNGGAGGGGDANTDGVVNTGGGGGGGMGTDQDGGSGGSGIVIIRYIHPNL